MKFEYDVLVIGAGHAGCEAAAAAANLGAKTCLMTMDMNKIAQMSCNPAIGGIAKGQIVREIDALGGYMGIITDKAAIQFRMLNRSKGPAMWSPRAQCDRMKFSLLWRETLENIANLNMWQDCANELIVENGKAVGVKTQLGAEFRAKCTIITAGTFLNGLMHVGKVMFEGGRIAEPAAKGLTESICKHGIRSDRMKTGTPVRLDKRSINLELTERQDGENDFHRFSFKKTKRNLKQRPCWMCYTNPEVHDTLRSGLDESPLYNGQIQSIGPRYCPSIETKIVTFAERDRHLLFLEPEGEDTQEVYVNGFSSSLPMEIQLTALRKIPALKDAVAYRPGYAIEYDLLDPTQLNHTLESKVINNLYFAGQVNGTTGYEEAAGQGLIAGINAALKVKDKGTFTLKRDEAYIGVLIDDLVTKGCSDPYRMMTSRSEYRLLLRQDNADERLMPTGRELGLIDDKTYAAFLLRKDQKEKEIERLKATFLAPNEELNRLLEESGTAPISTGTRLSDLVKRPQISYDMLAPFDKERPDLPFSVREKVETEIKYEGYIARQQAQVNEMLRLEGRAIPDDIDYSSVYGLRLEAVEKLNKIRPANIGQASRISGVSPADISVLLIYLTK